MRFVEKSKLRKHYKSERKKLSTEDITHLSRDILANCLQLPIWDFSNYHIFYTIPMLKEVDTTPIIETLWERKKNVYLPKIKDDNLISYQYLPDTQLSENKFNILEPAHSHVINNNLLDVIFIPMLICDSEGNRVGYGEGFYDRLLQESKPEAIRIGINFYPPISQIIETNAYDQKLDYCVTPLETVSFSDKLSK